MHSHSELVSESKIKSHTKRFFASAQNDGDNQTYRHTEALAEVSNKRNSSKRFFGRQLPQNDYISALALSGTPLRSCPLLVQAQNDKQICHPELTERHPELTRKLVEYTKRNFLFLLGISGSQSKCPTKRFRNEFGMTHQKAAFTLAEILVTMSIIGVVAAMTIPNLYYSRVRQEYSAKIRNFYSRMSNAVLDMELDYGSFRDIRKPSIGDTDGLYDWYIKYLDPYMGHKMVKKEKRTVYFKDGTSFSAVYNGYFGEFRYDVNGDKGPNKLGFDVFLFLFAFDDNSRQNCFGNKETFFGVYCPAGITIKGVSRETLLQRCRDGFTTSAGQNYGAGAWCGKLLQNDQWEFKSDYPLKF